MDPASPSKSSRSEPQPSEVPRLVLGTAGHIDHGKTALVRALTGVDTDRLPEEKARGITIELGFAPLDLEGGLRVSLVDVPGHEGLVRTMVAGATGIDLVLLVVAADEGVMPQTREHLAICELLGLAHGVVALTKTDLVAPELAALAAEEVARCWRRGRSRARRWSPSRRRPAPGSPSCARRCAVRCSRAAPRTPRSGPPRLAIDRAFAAKGFGTVVTGTLLGGPLAVGDGRRDLPGRAARARARRAEPLRAARARRAGLALRAEPPGCRARAARARPDRLDARRARARGHARRLAGLAADRAARRGPRLGRAARGHLRAARAPRADRRGGADPGRVAASRASTWAGSRFRCCRATASSCAASRAASPRAATLGGGVVLDVAPPHRRRSDPQLLRELHELARREPATDVAVRISRAALAGMSRERLLAETGLAGDALDAALAALVAEGRVTRAGSALWLDASAASTIQQRILAALAAWHAAEPIRPGIPARTLRGRLPENVAPEAFEHALARLAERR